MCNVKQQYKKCPGVYSQAYESDRFMTQGSCAYEMNLYKKGLLSSNKQCGLGTGHGWCTGNRNAATGGLKWPLTVGGASTR